MIATSKEKPKQRGLERFFRIFLPVEFVALFLASGLKWITYRAYMNHTCTYRVLELRWKDAIFCVDEHEASAWNAINTVLFIALVTLIITWILAAMWKFIK